MRNIVYGFDGGAISLSSVTLMMSGNISFIDNEAYYGGVLSMSLANFLIVSEERLQNEMSIFNDTMKFCRNVAGNGGKESKANEFVRVLDGSYGNFNESGKGMAMFCGNMAASEGGGIKSADDSDIRIINGSMHFETNQALFGGGLHLGDNSKLILPSST